MNLLTLPLRSTLGAKYAMALTGLGLTLFVLVHMAGNLLIYAGPDALNAYAEALKDKPALLWAARSGLLFLFLVHLGLAYRLWRRNRAARPVAYTYEDTVQASWASRHMYLSGLVLLAFILFHLAHFTFGVVTTATVKDPVTGTEVRQNYLDLKDAHDPARPKQERHDVYRMVVAGFQVPWIVVTYLVAQVFLCLHLWHGGSSWLQSLGVNHPRYRALVHNLGPVLAVVVLVGNCSIPVAVLVGAVK